MLQACKLWGVITRYRLLRSFNATLPNTLKILAKKINLNYAFLRQAGRVYFSSRIQVPSAFQADSKTVTVLTKRKNYV